ncbi:MAG: signal peptidase I [Acutalibacteraceae bacterium]
MKKALNIIKNIIVWAIVILAVFMMIFTIFSVNTFDRSDRSIFGYKFFIVQSDSMSKTDFSAGDIVIVKEVDPATLTEGDIISYTSQNTDNFGETVTHKIRKLTKDANGNPGFITYGTTTDNDDETIVTYAYVLGKYTGHIPNVGMFFSFLKTTPGYICCIFIPFLLLILYQGINCIMLFKRYKKEQQAALDEEKAKIEQERAENLKMMEELKALREQLSNQTGSDSSDTPSTIEPDEQAPTETDE